MICVCGRIDSLRTGGLHVGCLRSCCFVECVGVFPHTSSNIILTFDDDVTGKVPTSRRVAVTVLGGNDPRPLTLTGDDVRGEARGSPQIQLGTDPQQNYNYNTINTTHNTSAHAVTRRCRNRGAALLAACGPSHRATSRPRLCARGARAAAAG